MLEESYSTEEVSEKIARCLIALCEQDYDSSWLNIIRDLCEDRSSAADRPTPATAAGEALQNLPRALFLRLQSSYRSQPASVHSPPCCPTGPAPPRSRLALPRCPLSSSGRCRNHPSDAGTATAVPKFETRTTSCNPSFSSVIQW